MSLQTLCPIHTLSEDPNYAWQVLELQIAIDLSETAREDHVAKLLSLYLEGAEMTNSALDPRESYFRAKATQLMTKQNVVRGLNKTSKKKTSSQQLQQPNKQSAFALYAQKKRQIEMRLAYETEQNNRQILKKLLAQQAQKESNLTKAIEEIIQSHEQILRDRIKKRKLKATTSPSQTEINQLPNFNLKQIHKNQLQLGNNFYSNLTLQQRKHTQLSTLSKRAVKSICSQACQENFQLSPRQKRRNSFSLNYFFKPQLQS